MNEPGLLLVITGPSGAGKSSVIKALLLQEPALRFSVSHTTRPPRPDEIEGTDYRFVPKEAFDAIRAMGGFLEWAEVHGHLYGTSLAEVEGAAAAGGELLLDIDVQGAAQVASKLPESVSIFLLPPDYSALEDRLRGRRSEAEAEIDRRLKEASAEVARYAEFDYLVVNASVEKSTAEIRAILAAERLKTKRRGRLAERVLATFPSAPLK